VILNKTSNLPKSKKPLIFFKKIIHQKWGIHIEFDLEFSARLIYLFIYLS